MVRSYSTSRLRREINRGEVVNVHAGPWRPLETSEDKLPERSLRVNVPIMKDLLGYRRLLIRRDDLARFRNIRQADELKPLVVGQANGWFDVEIYRHNGYRVNDTVYDQAFLGSEFPLDLDLVERVEFIPGQGSAVHGANALYGVVNVVTRHPAQGAARELALSFGQGNARQARMTGSIGLSDGASLLLSATALRMAGTDAYFASADTPATGNGISHDSDHERNTQFFARYSTMDLSASIVHSDRIKGLTNSPGTVFGDPRMDPDRSRIRRRHWRAPDA